MGLGRLKKLLDKLSISSSGQRQSQSSEPCSANPSSETQDALRECAPPGQSSSGAPKGALFKRGGLNVTVAEVEASLDRASLTLPTRILNKFGVKAKLLG